MATHSSLLAWRISWIKGTGRLQWNTTEQLTLLPSGYRLLRWYLCIIVGFIASALEQSNILLYFMNQYKDEMASAIKISRSKKMVVACIDFRETICFPGRCTILLSHNKCISKLVFHNLISTWHCHYFVFWHCLFFYCWILRTFKIF